MAKVRRRTFVRSERESTWVMCTDGPDGIAQYEDDGWKKLERV